LSSQDGTTGLPSSAKEKTGTLKERCKLLNILFSDDARSYVSQIGSKIVLIDGEQLTSLMIEHDVGVSTVSLYPVKKIDTDYFDEGI